MEIQAQPTGFAGQNDRTHDHKSAGAPNLAQTLPQSDDAKGGFRRVGSGQVFGYARISRGDHQVLDRQRDELAIHGAIKIFVDEVSGGRAAESRPGFQDALSHLRAGDVLLAVSLDRLGRSLTDLMSIVEELVEVRGVTVRVLNLGDLSTREPLSKLLLSVLGAVAELERSLIQERTKSGLAAAKRRGVQLGRRPSLTPAQIAGARAMRAGGASAVATAAAFGVSERTIRRVTA